MAPRILLCCLAVVAPAGCGSDEREPAAPGEGFAQLVVTVDPDGRGPKAARQTRFSCSSPRESTVCAEADRLRPADLVPPEDEMGCTARWAGPETARIVGRLHGRALDARLARTNGCEIGRWDLATPLLEAAG